MSDPRSQDYLYAAIGGMPRGWYEKTRRAAILVIFFDLLQARASPPGRFVTPPHMLFLPMQMALYILSPIWGWNIDNKKGFWLWLYRAQLNFAMGELSYSAFMSLMLVAAGFTFLTVLLLLKIGWNTRMNQTSSPWLLHPARLLLLLLNVGFFSSVINIYLMPLGCDWWGMVIPFYRQASLPTDAHICRTGSVLSSCRAGGPGRRTRGEIPALPWGFRMPSYTSALFRRAPCRIRTAACT